jgi:hypothetical protein
MLKVSGVATKLNGTNGRQWHWRGDCDKRKRNLKEKGEGGNKRDVRMERDEKRSGECWNEGTGE